MSAIVRAPNGSIKLFVKGADTVILERLAKTGNPHIDSTCVYLEVCVRLLLIIIF